MATSSQPLKMRVNRPFLMEGKLYQPGDECTLPPALAAELMTARKVERASHDASAEHTALVAEYRAKQARKAGGKATAKVAA